MCIRDRFRDLALDLRFAAQEFEVGGLHAGNLGLRVSYADGCLLYTSDAADERSSVDLGGRRIIKKKTKKANIDSRHETYK